MYIKISQQIRNREIKKIVYSIDFITSQSSYTGIHKHVGKTKPIQVILQAGLVVLLEFAMAALKMAIFQYYLRYISIDVDIYLN